MQDAGDFLRTVMDSIADQQGVERWAEKTPAHLLYIPQIKEIIPEAQIIHIIRDGRNVAASIRQSHVGKFLIGTDTLRDGALSRTAARWEPLSEAPIQAPRYSNSTFSGSDSRTD